MKCRTAAPTSSRASPFLFLAQVASASGAMSDAAKTDAILIALVQFAFVSSITPGPNIMMLLASGANFGFRRTVPHMLGISVGHSFMVILLGMIRAMC